MPLKGKREAPGSREGSPKRKILKTEEEEAWSTTPIDPLADSVIFVSEVIPPSAGLKLVDLPMKKHRCSVLTSIGSDLEMTEDIPLDKSRLPDFLHTPPPFSSSESSDDDLKPVNFRTPINKRPSSHDFDDRLSHFKSEENLEYSLKRTCFENNLSPVEKSSHVDKRSLLTNTDPVQSPVVASFEDGRRVLPPLKLEYDMSPPYERDLEFLVITNGLVSLSISKVCHYIHCTCAGVCNTCSCLLCQFLYFWSSNKVPNLQFWDNWPFIITCVHNTVYMYETCPFYKIKLILASCEVCIWLCVLLINFNF